MLWNGSFLCPKHSSHTLHRLSLNQRSSVYTFRSSSNSQIYFQTMICSFHWPTDMTSEFQLRFLVSTDLTSEFLYGFRKNPVFIGRVCLTVNQKDAFAAQCDRWYDMRLFLMVLIGPGAFFPAGNRDLSGSRRQLASLVRLGMISSMWGTAQWGLSLEYAGNVGRRIQEVEDERMRSWYFVWIIPK